MDTFGITDKDKILGGIDGMNPTNKAELTEFSEALIKKIGQFKHLDDFSNFIEELVLGVSVNRKYIKYLIYLHFINSS